VSRRKKKQATTLLPTALATVASAPVPVTTAPAAVVDQSGPELLRKMLLMLMTAWLVARPLVIGDDPGMLNPWTNTNGLVFTQLLFVIAVGWGVWRWWSGEGGLHVGLVEAFLLLTVGFVLFSLPSADEKVTTDTAYRLPAILIGWEWLAYALVLFLVRQLAVSEGEQRGLTAVLLASLVSICAHGWGQFLFGLPPHPVEYDRQRLQAAKLQHLLGSNFVEMPAAISPHATSTFANGEQFATFAILLIPVLIGALIVHRQHQPKHWQTLVTLGLCIVAGCALWVSFAPLALAALTLAGVSVLLYLLLRKQVAASIALSGIAALALLTVGMFYGSGWFQESGGFNERMALRQELWGASWDLIGEKKWTGYGSGNIENRLLQKTTADRTEASPHNFVLEVWASNGLPAVFCLVGAVIAFVAVMVRRDWKSTDSWTENTLAVKSPAAVLSPPNRYAHWEYYMGGMCGLLLGYLLREISLSPDESLYGVLPSQDDILHRSLVAGGRAVIWFVSFAFFVNVPWSKRLRGVVLTTGALAALVHLLVTDGIGAPALMVPLLTVMGLALNARDVPPIGTQVRYWLVLVLPLPLVLGVGLAYMMSVFNPVTGSETRAVNAQAEGRYYLHDHEQKPPKITKSAEFINDGCIKPLYQAATGLDPRINPAQLSESGPGSSRLYAILAYWYGELWAVWRRETLEQKMGSDQQMFRALAFTVKAQELDRASMDPWIVEYHLHRRFGQGLKKFPEEERRQYQDAIDAAKQLVDRKPGDPHWHFLHAQALKEWIERLEPLPPAAALVPVVGSEVQGVVEILASVCRETLEIDAKARPSQRLNAAQREKMRAWQRLRQG